MTDVGPEALALLSVEEAAIRLSVGPKTIHRLCRAEDKEPGTGLESVRIGTRRLITPEAVLAFKARLVEKSASARGAA